MWKIGQASSLITYSVYTTKHKRRRFVAVRRRYFIGTAARVPAICLAGSVADRVVSVLDPGAEGPGFKSQPRRCPVTLLGKLFTHIVPLFTKQQNW